MTKETKIAIAGGALSALLMASAVPLLSGAVAPLFAIPAYLSQLPLLLVGLGLGVSAAIKAGVVASVASALAADVFYGLLFAALIAVPAILVTGVVLTRRPAPDGTLAWAALGHSTAVLCAFVAGAILLAVVLGAGLEGGLFGQLERAGEMIASELNTSLGNDAAVDQERILLDMFVEIAPYAPGILGASWLLMLAVNGALAQFVLSRTGHNLRPTPALSEFSVPGWLSIAWGTSVLAWIAFDGTAGALAANLALVLIVPFFIAGLAVIHWWAARVRMRWIILAWAYGLMVFVLAPVAVLIIMIGLIDDVVNLRRGGGSVQTSHSDRDAADNDED
jgi:hypothetical protein